MNNVQSVGNSVASTPNHVEFSTFIPLKFVKRGGRSVVEPPENVAQVIKDHAQLPDTKLVEGLTSQNHRQHPSRHPAQGAEPALVHQTHHSVPVE